MFRASFSHPFCVVRDRVLQVSVLYSDVFHSSTSRALCICLNDVGIFVIFTEKLCSFLVFAQPPRSLSLVAVSSLARASLADGSNFQVLVRLSTR